MVKLRSDDIVGVREKFALVRKELAAALIEREDEIDLVLTALIANEHVLLVGPPGCGKSLLLDSVLSWTGGKKFSILLTKFTTIEEVMGPVSLAALKEDRYVRVTGGKLPEADFAFVDEVMKASSAILNCLLKILNERVFDVGDGVARKVPLKLCLAASNEWASPETGKELAALSDRFLLRKTVASIRSQVGRQRLLWTREHAPKLSTMISGGGCGGTRIGERDDLVDGRQGSSGSHLEGACQGRCSTWRSSAVQDGRRGSSLRLSQPRKRSPARASGNRSALPVGRSCRATA